MDRATFVTCQQGIFPWIPEAVHCFVDSKLLFKSEVFRDSQRLPGEVVGSLRNASGFDTIVLRDCNHIVQYVVRVQPTNPSFYEIYNRLGELVAQTAQDQAFTREDVMRINDEQGLPVAIAQTPALQATASYGSDRPAQRGEGQLAGTWPPTREDVDVLAPWQIKSFDAYTSQSSLIIAQNRWVLAAVVQDYALRGVWQQPSLLSRAFLPVLAITALVGGVVCLGRSIAIVAFRTKEEGAGPAVQQAKVLMRD